AVGSPRCGTRRSMNLLRPAPTKRPPRSCNAAPEIASRTHPYRATPRPLSRPPTRKPKAPKKAPKNQGLHRNIGGAPVGGVRGATARQGERGWGTGGCAALRRTAQAVGIMELVRFTHSRQLNERRKSARPHLRGGDRSGRRVGRLVLPAADQAGNDRAEDGRKPEQPELRDVGAAGK